MHPRVGHALRAGFAGLALLASTAVATAEIEFNATEGEGFAKWREVHAARRRALTAELVDGQDKPGTDDAQDPDDPRAPAQMPEHLPDAGAMNAGPFPGTFSAGGRAALFSRPLPPGPAAGAATSGTLATATGTNYSNAPWVITAGDGTYPSLAGWATFNEQTGTVPGTLPAVPTLTIDVPVTLSGLTFNSVYPYQLSGGTGGALNLSSTGTNTLNVEASNLDAANLLATGSLIAVPIGGGGAFGLTKTGPGVVTLAAANTYTGGTFIRGGTLRITTGDAALGATGPGGDVTLNGGTLRVVTTGLTTARSFTLGAGNGTLEILNTSTINGVIGGPGDLTVTGGSGLTLTGAATYTGATTLLSAPLLASSLTLSGGGTLTKTSGLDLTGALVLNNGTANVNDRVGGVPIVSRGSTITLAGGATAGTPTTETPGLLTLAAGSTTLLVNPGTGGAAAFNPAGLARQDHATLFVRGPSLGAATGGGAQIRPAAGVATVGGGGAAGSQTLSIVPWIVGNPSASVTAGSSLVTYTKETGLRPLDLAKEYLPSLSGATAATNVRLTTTAAAVVPAGGATVNALALATSGTAALTSPAGGVLTITSGALLYSPATNADGTVSANLDFGPAEGILSGSNSNASLTLSGTIAGTGGLTLNAFTNTALDDSPGNFVLTNKANTYTGTTTLLNGVTTFTGTITNDGTPSAFGRSTTVIVLNTGVTGTRLWAAAAGATINRDLAVTGAGTGNAGLGTVGSYKLTVNGNVDLRRFLTLEGGSAAETALVLNGNVSGAGFLTDRFGSYNVLNGNNTFSGGINVAGGTYVAGTDTAFGTGAISSTASAGGIQGGGPGTRTLANPFLFGNNATVAFSFKGTSPLILTGSINLNGTTSLAVANPGGTTFRGVVANGGLIKSGAGTLTLANANTYTGGTVINKGSVLVTNLTGSGTGTGAVSVTGAGTLLGGTGGIAAPGTTLGTGSILQAGSGTASGALTLNTNLTLVSGSVLQFALGEGGAHSTLRRTGGTWNFAATQAFGFASGGAAGFYDDLITGLASDPGTEAKWTFANAGYQGAFIYDGAGSIDLTLTAVPVPEPVTALGGGLTAGWLVWAMWRRRGRG